MNMPPPNLPRLHWSPVEPSWIVSTGLVILAVLPHQIPATGRRVIEHPIGSLLFAALSAYVAWKLPVLGAAMFIFLAGLVLHKSAEPFAANNLNKDKLTKRERHRWEGEVMLEEKPKAVQTKTEDPNMSYDEITDVESEPWQGEQVLDEQPHAIQDRRVGQVPEYDEGGASYGHR